MIIDNGYAPLSPYCPAQKKAPAKWLAWQGISCGLVPEEYKQSVQSDPHHDERSYITLRHCLVTFITPHRTWYIIRSKFSYKANTFSLHQGQCVWNH